LPQQTALVPTIVAPEKVTLGPAMAQLTENQQNFVWALVQTGGDNSKAAALAGIGGTPDARSVAVYRLTHSPKVQAAIKEVAEGQIRGSAFLGAAALMEIAADPLHKDRAKAAIEIMNRSGMLVVQETKVTVEHKNPDINATVARIRALAEGMHMDAKPLLLQAGVPQDIIDAEFEVVSEERVQVSDMSAAGLEDLL
jgi:phage terminase small subunit